MSSETALLLGLVFAVIFFGAGIMAFFWGSHTEDDDTLVLDEDDALLSIFEPASIARVIDRPVAVRHRGRK